MVLINAEFDTNIETSIYDYTSNAALDINRVFFLCISSLHCGPAYCQCFRIVLVRRITAVDANDLYDFMVIDAQQKNASKSFSFIAFQNFNPSSSSTRFPETPEAY